MITVNSKGVKLKAWSNQEGTGVSGWKSARGHPCARLEYGETWGSWMKGVVAGMIERYPGLKALAI